MFLSLEQLSLNCSEKQAWAISEDSDQMPKNDASDQDLHSLPLIQ